MHAQRAFRGTDLVLTARGHGEPRCRLLLLRTVTVTVVLLPLLVLTVTAAPDAATTTVTYGSEAGAAFRGSLRRNHLGFAGRAAAT